MKKLVMLLVIVSLLTVALSSAVFADGHLNPAKICKNGGVTLLETVLTQVFNDAHDANVTIEISQGACVSVVATHVSANGVNVTGLATDVCKQVVSDSSSINGCVEHASPALSAFHDFLP